MGVRPERVAHAIRREICNILQEEIKDPRVGFITITRVDVTADMRTAKVYYSVLGKEKEKKATKAALKSGLGFIRGLIGDRIKLRFTPELLFIEDKSLEYSQKIDELLDRIKKEKTWE